MPPKARGGPGLPVQNPWEPPTLLLSKLYLSALLRRLAAMARLGQKAGMTLPAPQHPSWMSSLRFATTQQPNLVRYGQKPAQPPRNLCIGAFLIRPQRPAHTPKNWPHLPQFLTPFRYKSTASLLNRGKPSGKTIIGAYPHDPADRILRVTRQTPWGKREP